MRQEEYFHFIFVMLFKSGLYENVNMPVVMWLYFVNTMLFI